MTGPQQVARQMEKLATSEGGGGNIDPEMAANLSRAVHELGNVFKIMPKAIQAQAISELNGVFDSPQHTRDRDLPQMHLEADGSLTVLPKNPDPLDPVTIRVLPTGEVDDYEQGRKFVAIAPIKEKEG